MEVQVKCPNCGSAMSVRARRVVRRCRCKSCARFFVPAAAGVLCPKCGAEQILPPHTSKRVFKCLNCGFAFRRPPPWLTKLNVIRFSLLALLIVGGTFVLARWRLNIALARELRADFKRWHESLPRVHPSENGMFEIGVGLTAFQDVPPSPMRDEELDLNKEEHLQALWQYLSDRKPALEKIREGLKYKEFECFVDYSMGYNAQIPNLLAFKNAANSFVWEGDLARHEGDHITALGEYLNAIRLGKSLANERFIICHSERLVLEHFGLQPLILVLSQHWLTREELEYTLRTLVELHGKGVSFDDVMEGEYYCYNSFIIANLADGNFDPRELGYEGWVPLSLYFSSYYHDYRSDIEKQTGKLNMWRGITSSRYHEALKIHELESDAPTWHADFDNIIASMTTAPNYSSLFEPFIENEATFRGAIVLTGIRLYQARTGHLPGSLDELTGIVPEELLIDPFTGKRFIYINMGDDFYLYSTGYDAEDDGSKSCTPIYDSDWQYWGKADTAFHASPKAPAKQGK